MGHILIITNFWSGDLANLKDAIDQFRLDVQAGGAGDPYIVVVSTAQNYSTLKTALGADAVSGYISSFTSRNDGTYAQLVADTETYWNTQKATGDLIPLVMCGWNRKPRIERPVPWEVATQRAYIGLGVGVHALPTNIALAAHFQAAVTYVNANPVGCQSRAILAYAWNECDEGGWLIPTLGDPTGSRLNAIKDIIRF